MALTKAEIATILRERVGFNFSEAKELIELFFDTICQSLESGCPVHISGLGNFNLRDKGPRPGRNPKTKEDVEIQERRVVTFRASQKLKDKVEQIVSLPEDK